MKTKHTPGPWYNHGEDGLFDSRTGGPTIQTADGEAICAVEAVDADLPDEVNERRLADANLIAAAPDMLEALIQFERAWREFVRENPGVNMGAFTQALCQSGQAIAKATGGEE